MIGAIRDITREREAERAQREAADLYHTLFAQAVNPAYHIAADGRFLDANDAGLAFLAIDGNSSAARTSRLSGGRMRCQPSRPPSPAQVPWRRSTSSCASTMHSRHSQ